MNSLDNTQIPKVLTLMLNRPEDHHHVQDLSRNAGLPLATIYAILEDLEHKGWVSHTPPKADHLSPQLYAFTEVGLSSARQWVAYNTPMTHEERLLSNSVHVLDFLSILSR